MSSWETDHSIKSPWGFSLNEAFEAFKFKQTVLGNDSAFNEYNPDRRKIDLTMFSNNYVCEYPHCSDQKKGTGKWCEGHVDLLVRLRKRRDEIRARNWKAYQDYVDAERRAEAQEAFRRNRLRKIDEHIRGLEYQEIRALRKINLEEYKAYKREIRVQQKAARAALRESQRKPRYTGPPRKGYVYRIYDPEDVLLYVGKTFNVKSRLFGRDGHSYTKHWWETAHKVRILEYKTEEDALLAEAFAIKREKPKFNIAQPIPKGSRSPRRLCEKISLISGTELTPVEPSGTLSL